MQEASGSNPDGSMMQLTEEKLERYARHVIMPEIGREGQEKLKQAKVVIIGMGGLGSSASVYLAAAGTGTIGIADFDTVETTNLQRQVLYTERDVGKKKVLAAKQRLVEINSGIDVIVHDIRVTEESAQDIIKDYGVVIDGTDNPQSKYAISDACVRLNKPDVSASIHRFEGQLAVFQKNSCYRCLFPRFPETKTCAEAGVLGALAGILGSMQAAEAIKLVIGKGRTLAGKLLVIDALNMGFRTLSLKKNPDCSACNGCTGETEITAEELKRVLGKMTLVDVREPREYKICRIEGAKLMPMKELSSRLKELDKDDDIVLYCHRGNRSTKAAAMLKESGFKNARSLAGGIDEWARKFGGKRY